MGRKVSHYEYRWYHRLVSASLGLLGTNWSFFSLEPEQIVATAKRQTGLDDFGEVDCLNALAQLMHSAQNSGLSPLGRLMTRTTCIKAMHNRLWLRHWEKERPELFGRIEKPIFIVGLPRSGTTLLQKLIACDPKRRALPFWEILTPCPLSTASSEQRKRRRIGAQIVRGAYFMAPEQRFIHHISADSAEECWPIMFNSYAVLNFDLAQGFEGWSDWLLEHGDMRQSYATYRRFLEICQGRIPEQQLVLKCPEHLWFLPQLIDCFPDAEMVWTHRDLAEILPSYASLSSLIQRTLRGRIDPIKTGQRLLPLFERGLQRALSARQALQHQICDIAFKDICDEPILVVERIYQHFGRAVTEEHRHAMSEFLSVKRSDYRGAHKYSAAQWGLDTAAISEMGQAYRQVCGQYL